LEVAYRAAKSADPSTTVVFGAVAYDRYTSATAPAGWKAPPGPFNGHFTREVLADLEGREGGPVRPRPFDAVSVHNYNDNAHFWDGGGRREVVARLSAFRRDELDAGGVSPVVPVIVSEVGLATSPSDQWTERNPSHQAAYLVQTMIRGVAAGAELTVWYTARDNLTGDCAPPHYDWLTFGLMPSEQVAAALAACPGQNWAPEYVDSSADLDAALRPAFTALSVLLDVAGRSTYDRNLTAEETGDGQIEAYRLRDGQNRAYLVAWAEGGNRLGARSEAPPAGNLRLDANVIPEWTGVVSRIDAFGVPSRLGRPGGESVTLTVGETPVYLTAAP
ncbi:MAG: hypothetical protein ACE5EL_08820, partial [Anaerolineae bacterium]